MGWDIACMHVWAVPRKIFRRTEQNKKVFACGPVAGLIEAGSTKARFSCVVHADTWGKDRDRLLR